MFTELRGNKNMADTFKLYLDICIYGWCRAERGYDSDTLHQLVVLVASAHPEWAKHGAVARQTISAAAALSRAAAYVKYDDLTHGVYAKENERVPLERRREALLAAVDATMLGYKGSTQPSWDAFRSLMCDGAALTKAGDAFARDAYVALRLLFTSQSARQPYLDVAHMTGVAIGAGAGDKMTKPSPMTLLWLLLWLDARGVAAAAAAMDEENKRWSSVGSPPRALRLPDSRRFPVLVDAVAEKMFPLLPVIPGSTVQPACQGGVADRAALDNAIRAARTQLAPTERLDAAYVGGYGLAAAFKHAEQNMMTTGSAVHQHVAIAAVAAVPAVAAVGVPVLAHGGAGAAVAPVPAPTVSASLRPAPAATSTQAVVTRARRLLGQRPLVDEERVPAFAGDAAPDGAGPVGQEAVGDGLASDSEEE
jgi:hypothetical protein